MQQDEPMNAPPSDMARTTANDTASAKASDFGRQPPGAHGLPPSVAGRGKTVIRAGRGNDPVTAGLQQLFASIEDEPIPDDFLRLLDEIEARSTAGKGDAA